MKRTLPLLILLLLAGCAPLPRPFVSPRAAPASTVQMYLPLVVSVPNKLGIAGCGQVATLGGSWCYSWSPWPGAAPGIETVPMIRDASNINVTQLGGNSDWLMGFNEPDLCPEQACLTPEQAVPLWREVERKWPEKRLVAPAPSHLHPEWLVQWYLAYQDRYGQAPRVNALALHCYLSATECIALAEKYQGFAQAHGIREGWLTEFAYTDVTPDWQAQIAQLVTYVEQSAFWTRYAPFVSHETCDNVYWNCATAGDPSLFDRFGQLTDIGRSYLRAPE